MNVGSRRRATSRSTGYCLPSHLRNVVRVLIASGWPRASNGTPSPIAKRVEHSVSIWRLCWAVLDDVVGERVVFDPMIGSYGRIYQAADHHEQSSTARAAATALSVITLGAWTFSSSI